MSMKTHDFFYDLPQELIAQEPIEPRDHSRLLSVNRVTGEWEDTVFTELPRFLRPGDCLILNDSRVLPASTDSEKIPAGRWSFFCFTPREMTAGRYWRVRERRPAPEQP